MIYRNNICSLVLTHDHSDPLSARYLQPLLTFLIYIICMVKNDSIKHNNDEIKNVRIVLLSRSTMNRLEYIFFGWYYFLLYCEVVCLPRSSLEMLRGKWVRIPLLLVRIQQPVASRIIPQREAGTNPTIPHPFVVKIHPPHPLVATRRQRVPMEARPVGLISRLWHFTRSPPGTTSVDLSIVKVSTETHGKYRS